MNLNTAPRWAQRCGIEVKSTEQGLPGRRGCWNWCRPEEIQGKFGVGYEEVPSVGRERWRCASEDGEKMVLEGTDGAFRCISAVDVRRDKLQFALVICDGSLEGSARLVVHDVECRRSADGLETGKHVEVGWNAVAIMFGSKRAHQDGVGGGVEPDHDVLVATLCARVETARIIRKEAREWKFVEFERRMGMM